MAQDDKSVYYKTAYDYLREVPKYNEGGLNLSDTIVHIDLSTFYEELSTGNAEAMLFELDSIDRERSAKQHVLPQLPRLSSGTSSKYTLFFSEVIGDKLLAEVFKNKGMKNESHGRLSAFNRSEVFLFIFDQQKISKVYSKEVQYD